jgi:hypothetical protein
VAIEIILTRQMRLTHNDRSIPHKRGKIKIFYRGKVYPS